jgi:hypothetical protein
MARQGNFQRKTLRFTQVAGSILILALFPTGCGHNTNSTSTPPAPTPSSARLNCQPQTATGKSGAIVQPVLTTCVVTNGLSMMHMTLTANVSWVDIRNGAGGGNSVSDIISPNASISFPVGITLFNLTPGTYNAIFTLTSAEYPTQTVGFSLIVN